MKLSIQAQIAEVKREIELRKRVYPIQVRNRNMKEAEADYHLSAMESVLRSLLFIQDNETGIREYITQKNGTKS